MSEEVKQDQQPEEKQPAAEQQQENQPAAEQKPAEQAPAAEEKAAPEVAQEQAAPAGEEKTEGSGAAAAGEKKLPPKVEIPKNCGACKKPIHKIRYYRNMQFFCNRKCWEKFKKAQEVAKKKAEAEAQEQAQ